MFTRISQVSHIKDYKLELVFTNGIRSTLDFRDKVVGRGGVFSPLEDVDFFRQVQIDPEIGTLVWPNDVDFDPDVLYSEATGEPLPVPEYV